MSSPYSDFEEAKARVLATEAKVRELVQGETVLVQLDAVLSAYLQLATKHGQLHTAGHVLVQVGASIVWANTPPPAVPAAEPPPGRYLH